MKNKIKTVLFAACALALTVLLSGCLSMSADELYQLPKLSEGDVQLQERINELLASGAEYAAPLRGNYRQAVQLVDIDGDGTDEAVACFSVRGAENPLRVYIFREVNGKYEEATCIYGEGTSVERLDFADMNGDGTLELAVGWQLADGVNMLSVFSLNDYEAFRIINTSYSTYIMTQLAENDNIFVLYNAVSGFSADAELFSMTADGEIVGTTADLSEGTQSLLRVRTGKLADGKNAVYVESTAKGNGIMTDIFTYSYGKLINLTRDETTGASRTHRLYTVYCRDVNGDGILDVPVPELLSSPEGMTSYYIIHWVNYGIGGQKDTVCVTYHNYTDEWCLVIPESWAGKITIRRENEVSGERAIIFSEYSGSTLGKDILAIYALTGDNRMERAKTNNRIILKETTHVIYAAEVLSPITGASISIDAETVIANFDIIYSEWIPEDI